MSDPEYSFAAEFQAIFIPKQKAAPDALPEELRMTLSSYPPLGQVTQVPSRDVTFHAILDIHEKHASEPWQVALWHSSGEDGGVWNETLLVLAGDGKRPTSLQNPVISRTRFSFHASVSVQRSLKFTLKFRSRPGQEWRWIRDEQNLGDGAIVVNDESIKQGKPENIHDIIKDLHPSVQVKTAPSQCPGTELWSLEVPIAGATDEESCFRDIELGLPWGRFLR